MKTAFGCVLTILLFSVGCETFKNDNCPLISDAPVSGCRAQLKCQLRKKSYYNLGFRTSAQHPENYGVETWQSPVTDNFNDCVSRELEEQQAAVLILKAEKNNKE